MPSISPLDFEGRIDVYTTCPQSKDSTTRDYLSEVNKVALWSDGCAGMLIYSDNSIVDSWLVAQTVVRYTRQLRPLVAVQPLYMHPYTAAKMVASIGFMHQRQLVLNMIAGGFNNDLQGFGDAATHDERYERLTEYGQVIRLLLEHDTPMEFSGKYYQFSGRMMPPLPEHLRPGFLMSGSSPAGRSAAIAIGAIGIEYPQPADKTKPSEWPDGYPRGIRIGIITAEQDEDAWQAAQKRFPANRRGQIARAMAMKISDSSWHKQLADGTLTLDRSSPYSLWPFNNGYTSCPYLIGSYDKVAAEISRYLRLGHTSFILDIPQELSDITNASIVFGHALNHSANGARKYERG